MRLIDADMLPSYHMEIKDADTGKIYVFDFVPVEVVRSASTVDALPLHCRIGDEVWVVGTKCLSGLYEDQCNIHTKYDECDDACTLDQEYIVFPKTVTWATFNRIHAIEEPGHFRWGETVFKTKEEAEAALAERKMNDGC